MLLSKATYDKYIFQKKEKQQYIAVGTVRMFIEPSAKHITRLTHSPYSTKIARMRCYTMLSAIEIFYSARRYEIQ